MHKFFGDWYRRVDIEPTGETLKLRWEGIEKFLAELEDKYELINLIPVFFGNLSGNKNLEKFREAIQFVDPAFQMRGNDEELKVLSGATLANFIETNRSDESSFLSIALCCYDLVGLRGNASLRDVVDAARKNTTDKAIEVRKVKDVSQLKTPLNINTEITNIKASTEASNFPQALPSIETSLTKINASYKQLTKYIEDTFVSQKENLQLQREESNILWWLFGGYSKDLNMPFSKIEPSVVPLLAGKELGDLTIKIPGPIGAEAFLDKILKDLAIKCPSEINLKKAVNNTSREWREKLIPAGFEEIEDFCPVHLAIVKSLETDGADDWIPSYQKKCALNVTTPISSIALAYQVYLERLLVRHHVEGEI